MIYTLTLNPAIDYVMDIDSVKPGEVNRSSGEAVFFGGKGINVSTVLSRLGVPSVTLGFVAGFTGEALRAHLREAGIGEDFCTVQGLTRINVKLKGSSVTEINGRGPAVSEGDVQALFKKLDVLTGDDTLVLAGSVPSTLPKDIYKKIMAHLVPKGVRFAVDAEGELLQESLEYRPFVIKPNVHELRALTGEALATEDEIISAAAELQRRGAVNVLVSMGGDGAILLDEHGMVHKAEAFKGKAVNTVGAGDSMLAGFLAGCNKGYDYALRLGTAAGGATAFSEGLADKAAIEALIATFGDKIISRD